MFTFLLVKFIILIIYENVRKLINQYTVVYNVIYYEVCISCYHKTN